MEFRQLEYLIAIAEEQHFTRAAARCNVSQSTISAAIGALEHELGTALFVRDARHVTITTTGQTLLIYARQILTTLEEGRQAVTGKGALQGTLRIGAIQTIGVVDLPQILTAFHRAHEQVKISLSHDSVPALLAATADEQLDLCFVDGPIDERRLVRHPLGVDTLHLIVPANDALSGRDSICLTDPALSARDFLNYRTDSALSMQIEAACATAGLARNVTCEVQSIQYLLECTRSGLGLAILPRSAVDAQPWALASVPITPKLTRHLSVARTRRHSPSPVAAAFLEVLDAMSLH